MESPNSPVRRPLEHLFNDSVAISEVSFHDSSSSGEHDPPAGQPPGIPDMVGFIDHDQLGADYANSPPDPGCSSPSVLKSFDVSFNSSTSIWNRPGVRGNGSSWYASSFIIVNAAMGAGVLNFPSAFDQAGGIAVGMVVQLILMLLAFLSLIILAWASDLRGSTTYHGTVGVLCGPAASLISSLVLGLYCFGMDVSYLIVVGDESDRIFETQYGSHFCDHWYLHRRFVICVTSFVVILPLCFSKKIDFLKTASAAATLGVLYLVVLVVYNYATNPLPPGAVIKHGPTAWTDVFLVVAPICFSYQCHVSAIPVYSCLANRELKEFVWCLSSAFAVCFLSYSIIGIFGYLTYGSLVQSDLWSSMAIENPAYVIGLLVFIFKLLVSYPILLFCGRQAFETVFLECFRIRDPVDIHVWEKRRRVAMTLVFFGLTLVCGCFLMDLGLVVGILGALASLFLLFFPGLVLLQAKFQLEEIMTPAQRIIATTLACGLMVLSVFLCGVVSVDMFYNHASPQKLINSCYSG